MAPAAVASVQSINGPPSAESHENDEIAVLVLWSRVDAGWMKDDAGRSRLFRKKFCFF
jgi:hypothetical protein